MRSQIASCDSRLLRPRTVRGLGALSIAAVLAAPTFADEFLWIGPAGGLWSIPAHWAPSLAAPPDGSADSARFASGLLGVLRDRRAVSGIVLEQPGALQIANGGRLDVYAGGVLCDGLLRISDRGELHFVAGAGLPVERTISGAGTIRLEGPRADIDADPEIHIVTSATLTISGQGKILASAEINGPILADSPGGVIGLDAPSLLARAALTARSGGTLHFNQTAVSMSAGGAVIAEPDGVVLLDGSSFSGGSIIGAGGLISTDANVTLDGVSISGSIGVPAASSLSVVSPVLAQGGGAITLGGPGPIAGISEFICFDPLTLSGNGSLVLAPATTPDGLPISARLSIAPGAVMTLADGYTLAGTGEVAGALRVGQIGLAAATLDAGSPSVPGRIDVTGALEVTIAGAVRCTLFGPTEHDIIAAGGPAVLAGEVQIEFGPGYMPTPGDQFLIVSGAMVQDAGVRLVLPAMPDAQIARILSRPDGLVLAIALCPADLNADGILDADDLGDFINCYFDAPACPRANFNADAFIDADDLGDYINAYFAGCV
ncbi:MAG: hypothetical protein AB7K52_11850 [Phycisphaerales bacterium]